MISLVLLDSNLNGRRIMIKSLIQICNTEYEIRVVSPKTIKRIYGWGRTDDELEGFTDFDNQRIYLNNNLHPHRLGITLVHEALHIIADQSGDTDVNLQESYVRMLEHGVYELINNFPEEFNGE